MKNAENEHAVFFGLMIPQPLAAAIVRSVARMSLYAAGQISRSEFLADCAFHDHLDREDVKAENAFMENVEGLIKDFSDEKKEVFRGIRARGN